MFRRLMEIHEIEGVSFDDMLENIQNATTGETSAAQQIPKATK